MFELNALSDSTDTLLSTQNVIKKVNCMLDSFTAADTATKTDLPQAYCLSLALWNLSCQEIRYSELYSKLLRIIWNLPPCSHTAHQSSEHLYNVIHRLSVALVVAAKASPSSTVQHPFLDSARLCYTSLT